MSDEDDSLFSGVSHSRTADEVVHVADGMIVR